MTNPNCAMVKAGSTTGDCAQNGKSPDQMCASCKQVYGKPQSLNYSWYLYKIDAIQKERRSLGIPQLSGY